MKEIIILWLICGIFSYGIYLSYFLTEPYLKRDYWVYVIGSLLIGFSYGPISLLFGIFSIGWKYGLRFW